MWTAINIDEWSPAAIGINTCRAGLPGVSSSCLRADVPLSETEPTTLGLRPGQRGFCVPGNGLPISGGALGKLEGPGGRDSAADGLCKSMGWQGVVLVPGNPCGQAGCVAVSDANGGLTM